MISCLGFYQTGRSIVVVREAGGLAARVRFPAARHIEDILDSRESNGKGVGKTGVFPWRKPACRQAGIRTDGF